MTDDGVELPVVDVTHPAFAINLSDAEIAALTTRFVATSRARARVPAFLLRAFYKIMLRRSVLARGISSAATANTFLSGMDTYLLKLGPENLGTYAAAVDRKIAASLPVLTVRLRLQDMAHLLAEYLAPRLEARPAAACRFVNIAGGPAMDSLNALILLARDRPGVLGGRTFHIHVFDLETAGASFGARALAALISPGAPLHGVDVRFERVGYDWNDAGTLERALAERIGPADVVAASSEGGLFEYGEDPVIVQNLDVLRRVVPGEACMAVSVTRADRPVQMKGVMRIPLKPKTLEAVEALAHRAGWSVTKVIERPFGRDVLLTK